MIVVLMFFHWVADFVCQSDWMAKNKSHDNKALALHVGTYSLVMLILCLIAFHFSWLVLLFVAVNGVLHFITDYVTSRCTSYLWKKGDVHNFFVMIGFDQFIHLFCIFVTMRWILGIP